MSEQTVDEPHLPSEGWSDFGAELSALMPSLARYARSLARNPDTAQDLVQETVLKAWSSRASFEAGTNMKAWTFRILRNSFLSRYAVEARYKLARPPNSPTFRWRRTRNPL